MGIYTRRGDDGRTRLADGSKVSKASLRVEALGDIDEAAAAIGFARESAVSEDLDAILRFAQQRLFNCSAALADPSHQGDAIAPRDVEAIERAIDSLSVSAGEWKGFVLASGGEAATRLHLARTVLRRAERHIVALAESEPVDPRLLSFVNRLSDLLFASARTAAAASGEPEDLWERSATAPGS